jgi:hypothetical protein
MIKWNEVTWYSKLAAIIFFVGIFPALSFYIGVEYEKTEQTLNQATALIPQAPRMQMRKNHPATFTEHATSTSPASRQTLIQLPNPDRVESITIDFSICSGKAFVATSFGSTQFEFKGATDGKCALSYGNEAELSPRYWHSCLVPANLSKKSFSATGVVNLSDLDPYCSTK